MTNRIGGVSGHFIYAQSWKVALGVAVMMSWGLMNLTAILFERRTMLNPITQSKAFWFGDLICLPGAVLVLRYLSLHITPGPHRWQNPSWHIACLAIGIAAGIVFHLMERANYRPTQWNSPTKLLHDLFVIPGYIYVLLSALPVLFVSAGGVNPRLVFAILFALFIALNVYDIQHPNPNSWHVDWLNGHRVYVLRLGD